MPDDSPKETFQFDFQAKPSEKKKTPSNSSSKPASKPTSKPVSKPASKPTSKPVSKPASKSAEETPSFNFGEGESKPKSTESNKETPKSKPTFSSPSSGKKPGTKPGKNSDKLSKSKKSKGFLDNPQNVVMLGIGGGVFFLLIIFALVFSGGSNEEVKKPKSPVRQVSAEERNRQIRAEKLRRQTAKFDAEYAASKRAPKSEKVRTLELADSQLRSGKIREAAQNFEKAHKLDPTDGYPVTQLIQINRDRLHNSAEAAKWERIGSDIAKGNLDKLHQRSEEKYHKE